MCIYTIKTRSWKSPNKNVSKGDSPWVLLKKLKFFHLVIWGKISQENASHDILQRKNVFLDYKNKTELDKVEKLALFSKALVHGFG